MKLSKMVLLCILAVAVSAVPVLAATQLVVNGNFESGVGSPYPGWNVLNNLGNGGITCDLAYSPYDLYNEYSMRLTDQYTIEQTFSTPVRTTSDLTFVATKRDNPLSFADSDTFSVIVEYSDGTSSTLTISGSEVTPFLNYDSNYWNYWRRFTVPVDHTKLVSAIVFSGPSNIDSSLYIDNVSLFGPDEIPEYPAIALPVISVIGMMMLFQRRKGN